MEVKEKRNLDKIVIIALLAAILVLVIGIGFLLISDQQMPDFATIFKSKSGEYTIPLEEFLVNLKSDSSTNSYLKIKIALMYLDEDHGNTINVNMSKVRDVVISNLRTKTSSELLSDEGISDLKVSIMEDINESLNVIAIEDIYITDIIVQ